jgi:hypothetical protein
MTGRRSPRRRRRTPNTASSSMPARPSAARLTTASGVLKEPITISGTGWLAIFSTVKDQAVIAVTANGGATTVIHEFEGTSSLSCLADKSDITLTRSPGGSLGTLLIVVGKGTIHGERYEYTP